MSAEKKNIIAYDDQLYWQNKGDLLERLNVTVGQFDLICTALDQRKVSYSRFKEKNGSAGTTLKFNLQAFQKFIEDHPEILVQRVFLDTEYADIEEPTLPASKSSAYYAELLQQKILAGEKTDKFRDRTLLADPHAELSESEAFSPKNNQYSLVTQLAHTIRNNANQFS